MGSPHRTLEMKGLLVLLLFAGVNGAPGVVYPQHLVYNPWFGTYAQPITYYYYYPQSRNVQETVNGRWWLSCSGPATGPDGNQCCLQDEGDCDSDSDCCEGLYCEQSWGNDYCAPKSAVSELPVSTETPQVSFPTETQQPPYNISNVMEWPYELKQLVLQQMDDGLPGFKSTIQMDQSLRFDTVMKKVLSLTDLDGNGQLSAEEMFKSESNQESIKEIREDIKRFDTNGDQQLSAEELKTLLREDTKKNFTEMDLNGDHIISLKEFTESEMGQSGERGGSMITIFAFESWLPESERNGASDWLALDYKEFEALLVSSLVWGVEKLESTNTEMQAQIVGYSNFKRFPAKLTIQAAQNAIQKNGKVFFNNIAGLL